MPTVLLTRNAEENARIAEMFEAAGLSTVSFPGIAIAEPSDWSPADAAIADMEALDGVFFTSRNAVRAFLGRIDAVRPEGRQILASMLVAAVGEKTEEALADESIPVAIVPEIGSAENLVASLDDMDLEGRRFLFPKSDKARDVLPTELRNRGAVVDEVVVYRTVPPEAADLNSVRDGLRSGTIDCVAFFSPSAVRNVVQMLGSGCLADRHIAVIGPTTGAAVRALGLSAVIMPSEPTTASFVQAVAERLAPAA